MIDCRICRIGENSVRPLDKVGDFTEDFLDFLVRNERRKLEFLSCHAQLFLRTRLAASGGTAKRAPHTCAEFSLSCIGEPCLFCKLIFCPSQKFVFRERPYAYILPARLEDAHGNGSDIIDSVEQFQCAEHVKHHLWIALRFHEHAHAVLEVDDAERISSDDDAVRRPESFQHIARKVKTLLDKRHRRRDFPHLFLHECDIIIRAVLHLFILEIRMRPLAAQMQKLAQLMLAERVRRHPFGGSLACSRGKLSLKPRGRWAVHPPKRRRRRQQCMYAHQSASASSRIAA